MVMGVSDHTCSKCKNSGRISKADPVLLRPEVLCDCQFGEIAEIGRDLAKRSHGPVFVVPVGSIHGDAMNWLTEETRAEHERELAEIDHWSIA